MKNKEKIILIGGGGHCMSVIDVIEQEDRYQIQGIFDQNIQNRELLGYPVLGGDELIPELISDNTSFLITVGQIKSYAIREKLAKLLDVNHARLATVVSPFAYVSKHSKVEPGTIIMHHAIVNAGATVGKHCIINTKANIEHGVTIEDFCHISTASVINGDSIVRRGTFIGSNATISHCITIEENSIVGASKFIK